jgi:hypothetical protein
MIIITTNAALTTLDLYSISFLPKRHLLQILSAGRLSYYDLEVNKPYNPLKAL